MYLPNTCKIIPKIIFVENTKKKNICEEISSNIINSLGNETFYHDLSQQMNYFVMELKAFPKKFIETIKPFVSLDIMLKLLSSIILDVSDFGIIEMLLQKTDFHEIITSQFGFVISFIDYFYSNDYAFGVSLLTTIIIDENFDVPFNLTNKYIQNIPLDPNYLTSICLILNKYLGSNDIIDEEIKNLLYSMKLTCIYIDLDQQTFYTKRILIRFLSYFYLNAFLDIYELVKSENFFEALNNLFECLIEDETDNSLNFVRDIMIIMTEFGLCDFIDYVTLKEYEHMYLEYISYFNEYEEEEYEEEEEDEDENENEEYEEYEEEEEEEECEEEKYEEE